MDDLDRAILIACAVNNPEQLKARQKDLEARLRHDPSTPEVPKFTRDEMRAAAASVMTHVLKSRMIQ